MAELHDRAVSNDLMENQAGNKDLRTPDSGYCGIHAAVRVELTDLAP